MRARIFITVAALAIGLAASTPAAAQTGESLGTVRIPQQVTANGQPLAAGTYTVRLSNEAVTPVVGQSTDSAKWVEFLQNGAVKGKELASVVAPADVKAVAKTAPPSRGRSRVQVLRGDDYVRVWVNAGGTQYLVHLAVTEPRPAAARRTTTSKSAPPKSSATKPAASTSSK